MKNKGHPVCSKVCTKTLLFLSPKLSLNDVIRESEMKLSAVAKPSNVRQICLSHFGNSRRAKSYLSFSSLQ